MFHCGIEGAAVALMFIGVAITGHVSIINPGFDPLPRDAHFTIDNLSSAAGKGLKPITSFGPTASMSLSNLAAGQSQSYQPDQMNDGFTVGFGADSRDDPSTHQLTLPPIGVLPPNKVIGTANKPSGSDVNVLGDTCLGYSTGCSAAISGTVAAIVRPKAPVSFSALAPGNVRRHEI